MGGSWLGSLELRTALELEAHENARRPANKDTNRRMDRLEFMGVRTVVRYSRGSADRALSSLGREGLAPDR